MSDSPGRVLVVTSRPSVAIQWHSILGHFDEIAYSVSPVFVAEPEAAGSRLVILDADSQLDWANTVRAEPRGSRERFVVISRNISPKLVHDALATGVHGLLSTALPPDEAAQALRQIRQGLHTFRFDREMETPKTAAAPAKRSRRRARWSCVCLD